MKAPGSVNMQGYCIHCNYAEVTYIICTVYSITKVMLSSMSAFYSLHEITIVDELVKPSAQMVEFPSPA